MRLLLALAAVLLVLLAGVAWLVLGSQPTPTKGIEVEGTAQHTDAAHEATTRAPSSPFQLATQPENVQPSEQRTSLAPPAPAPVADAIDASLPTSPLEARVIDQRTGLPLARYLVRIHDTAGRRIDVVSD